MIKRWLIIAPVAIALAWVCSFTAQPRIDRIRAPQTLDEALLYLPNEKLLTHFTAGMSSIVADLLWLKCVQYTALHFISDRKFTWLNHMCQTITRLDPYFVSVYRYGGMFLASLDANDDASLRLLHAGMKRNPRAWELPYEAAMVYLLNRRSEPGAQETAAAYLGMAVATGNAPRFVVEVAQGLLNKHNLVDIEKGMWEAMLKSDNELMRDLAERKLLELSARETCRKLNEAVQVFAQRYGRMPQEINELVSGEILVSLPQDPLGGQYFLDADGVVQNTSLLDTEIERHAVALRRAIDEFKAGNGRWPQHLDELVQRGLVAEMPAYPYKDRTWKYDPLTGALE